LPVNKLPRRLLPFVRRNRVSAPSLQGERYRHRAGPVPRPRVGNVKNNDPGLIEPIAA